MPAKKKSPATGRVKRTAPTAPAAAARVDLFDRVATILDQAQASAVRAVNTRMVLAYWLIGREIVEELQGGKERAAYGQQVLDDLSRRLTERFGKGFSVTNLRSFRIFYTIYAERVSQIQQTLSAEFNEHAAGREKTSPFPIQQTPSGEFDLAGVESICQTRSGESGSMEPGGRFWRIWNAPPPRVRSPTVIVSVLADLPRLREERMENGNISRASPAGGGRAAARHPAVRHPLGRS